VRKSNRKEIERGVKKYKRERKEQKSMTEANKEGQEDSGFTLISAKEQ